MLHKDGERGFPWSYGWARFGPRGTTEKKEWGKSYPNVRYVICEMPFLKRFNFFLNFFQYQRKKLESVLKQVKDSNVKSKT